MVQTRKFTVLDREYLSEEDITELYVLCDKLLEVEGSENVQNKKNYYIYSMSTSILTHFLHKQGLMRDEGELT